MGIFGKAGDREAKRAEQHMRSVLAQRDGWRAKCEALCARKDWEAAKGLMDPIVEMFNVNDGPKLTPL